MAKLTYKNIFEAVTDCSLEAASLRFRAILLMELRRKMQARDEWSQKCIMSSLGMSQPRASLLHRGRVMSFSADLLIKYLALIGHEVEPKISAVKK